MGRILDGSLMVLFVVVVNFMVAFITTGASDTDEFSRCDSDENFTSCENLGKTTFLGEVFDVTYTGIDGAPLALNALYVLILGFLFTVGVLLIVLGFVPTTSE